MQVQILNWNILIALINDITNLDVSSNINLKALVCKATKISSLDLTNNTLLFGLNCQSNPLLNKLNLKNGQNTNLLSSFSYSYNSNGCPENSNFTLNPSLSCIMVDDPQYSTSSWDALKDKNNFFFNNLYIRT